MNRSDHTIINAIDAILPQTQCELCTYKGCRPYAEAIVKNRERIDRCEPGGVDTLRNIAKLTDQDPEPFIPDMQKKTKPMTLAVIREDECIGCTKCIQACPVDAIIGASKQMHTVFTDSCNGCELCIPPCPVDCIDIMAHPKFNSALEISEPSRKRFEKRQRRLVLIKKERDQKHQLAKRTPKKGSLTARKAAIQAALVRVKKNKDRKNEPRKM